MLMPHPLHRWENQAAEKLGHLPMVPPLAGIWIQMCSSRVWALNCDRCWLSSVIYQFVCEFNNHLQNAYYVTTTPPPPPPATPTPTSPPHSFLLTKTLPPPAPAAATKTQASPSKSFILTRTFTPQVSRLLNTRVSGNPDPQSTKTHANSFRHQESDDKLPFQPSLKKRALIIGVLG